MAIVIGNTAAPLAAILINAVTGVPYRGLTPGASIKPSANLTAPLAVVLMNGTTGALYK